MFQNYLKVAWRNLFRNKAFSITNLLGLTIGMACTMFIFLWVQDELTYDQFHRNYKNIYQVIANRDFNNRIFTDRNMVLPMASVLGNGYPQIRNAAVTTHQHSEVFSMGDAKITKTGYTVSEKFFDVFTWRFIKGNAVNAISKPGSVVLTESAAKSFFGKEDPINKTIITADKHNLTVTAVVADPPGNSTFKFDFITPFDYNDPDTKRSMQEWGNSSWEVFVQTIPGADMKALEKHINTVKKTHSPGDKVSSYFAYPMSKWELYNDFKNGKAVGGMIEYVRLFTIIALIVLLIACVNFMNLSTARSEKRAKEVGIRKTLGSVKRQLILQFYVESMILALIAFVLALVAVWLLMPAFNLLVNKHLFINLSQPYFWIGSAAIILLTGIIAGSYPALYLSSFNPINVLKGTFLAGKSATIPRHALVVGQFVMSVVLISATIIVYQQIQFIKNRSIGYDSNNLIMVTSSDDINKNYQVIHDELVKSGSVADLARMSSPITQIWWRTGAPHWEGQPANADLIMSAMGTDVGFTKTLGIKLAAGQDFSGLPIDSTSMLLNKAAVEAMGLKNPIGQLMRYGSSNYHVIGVIDNVVIESPFKPVDPMMVFYQPNNNSVVHIRLKAGVSPKVALAKIEPIFKKYNPVYPFEYQFADQEFGKKFETEELINKLTNIFSGLAIFICCIGLAGLASFTIQKRFREIGIRKVLGATVSQVLMLISKEFLRLVAIAFVIAVPLSWWLMSNWLAKYDFHVSISIWLFVVVGALILLLTIAVVSLNTLRAAIGNPTKALRSE